MADIEFNIAKGKSAHYAGLPATNDALVLVPLEATGLETDAVLKDYDTLSALLAGASVEHAMGRKTLTGVTVTLNDTDDRNEVDADDVVWTGPTGNDTGAAVICYDPDTTGGTDADLIPLWKLDMAATLTGGDLTFAFNAAGIYHAT